MMNVKNRTVFLLEKRKKKTEKKEKTEEKKAKAKSKTDYNMKK